VIAGEQGRADLQGSVDFPVWVSRMAYLWGIDLTCIRTSAVVEVSKVVSYHSITKKIGTTHWVVRAEENRAVPAGIERFH
jgi:hypothetical protein